MRAFSVLFGSSLVFLVACSAQIDIAGLTGDSSPPAITAQNPVDDATVAPNINRASITVDEEVNVSESSVTLVCAGTSISLGNLSFDSLTRVLSAALQQDLPLGASCTLTWNITDASDNPRTVVVTFNVSNALDATSPTVSSSEPSNGATGVSTNLATLTFTFSEAMDGTRCAPSNISCSPTLTFASCSYNSDNNSCTCTLSSSLTSDTSYTCTLSSQTDAAGNSVSGGNPSVTFTTGSTADTTSPTVSSFEPANNATGVATNLSSIKANFSETMNSGLCSTSNASCSPSITLSSCTYSSNSCSCAISGSLSASTTYTCTFSGQKDTAGNDLSGSASTSFTTAAAADTTAPTVSKAVPANGDLNQSICQPIYICFSETINSDQCTTANATYTPAASPEGSGSFSYCCVEGEAGCTTPKDPSCSGTVFEWGLDWPTICGNAARSGGSQTWNVRGNLSAPQQYTITIQNVKDPSGNTMTNSSVSWTPQD
ncbi:MAG: Ig-like domain-containing protein [Deltaproteobacteria bacterium]|nr:Ig-like domain-containing protein [Deltaproteobacteria bacterium]